MINNVNTENLIPNIIDFCIVIDRSSNLRNTTYTVQMPDGTPLYDVGSTDPSTQFYVREVVSIVMPLLRVDKPRIIAPKKPLRCPQSEWLYVQLNSVACANRFQASHIKTLHGSYLGNAKEIRIYNHYPHTMGSSWYTGLDGSVLISTKTGVTVGLQGGTCPLGTTADNAFFEGNQYNYSYDEDGNVIGYKINMQADKEHVFWSQGFGQYATEWIDYYDIENINEYGDHWIPYANFKQVPWFYGMHYYNRWPWLGWYPTEPYEGTWEEGFCGDDNTHFYKNTSGVYKEVFDYDTNYVSATLSPGSKTWTADIEMKQYEGIKFSQANSPYTDARLQLLEIVIIGKEPWNAIAPNINIALDEWWADGLSADWPFSEYADNVTEYTIASRPVYVWHCPQALPKDVLNTTLEITNGTYSGPVGPIDACSGGCHYDVGFTDYDNECSFSLSREDGDYLDYSNILCLLNDINASNPTTVLSAPVYLDEIFPVKAVYGVDYDTLTDDGFIYFNPDDNDQLPYFYEFNIANIFVEDGCISCEEFLFWEAHGLPDGFRVYTVIDFSDFNYGAMQGNRLRFGYTTSATNIQKVGGDDRVTLHPSCSQFCHFSIGFAANITIPGGDWYYSVNHTSYTELETPLEYSLPASREGCVYTDLTLGNVGGNISILTASDGRTRLAVSHTAKTPGTYPYNTIKSEVCDVPMTWGHVKSSYVDPINQESVTDYYRTHTNVNYYTEDGVEKEGNGAMTLARENV